MSDQEERQEVLPAEPFDWKGAGAKPSWLPSSPIKSAETQRARKTSVAGALRRIETMTLTAFRTWKPRTMGEHVAARLFRIAHQGDDAECLRATNMILDRTVGKTLPAEREERIMQPPNVTLVFQNSVAPLPIAEKTEDDE